MGIEPTYAAWEAAVLPLNYARLRLVDLALFQGSRNPYASLARISVHKTSHFFRPVRRGIQFAIRGV